MTQRPDGLQSTALLERGDRPGLIYQPTVRRRGAERFDIIGFRDDPKIVPWGFWGGIFAASVGALVLAYEGLTGLWEIWNLAGPIAAITFGLLLMRFGTKSSLTEEPCATVDLRTQSLRLTSSTEGVALPEIALTDIVEIVYGMTRYPVSTSAGAVKVDAFSLLVRHRSNTLLPVIEASPDKEMVYQSAQFLAQVSRAPITHVGLGVR